MLDAGYALSDVTAALCRRWRPGVSLLPMTDQRCETHVIVESAEIGKRAIHFQEWWIKHRAALPAKAFVQVGLDDAKPAPGVLEAIAAADVVLFAPSNPVVSIGTILAVPGVRDALRSTAAPVVGFSPIVGGAARARHGRRVPAGHRRRGERPGRRAALRFASRRAECSTAGSCTTPTPPTSTASTCGRFPCS